MRDFWHELWPEEDRGPRPLLDQSVCVHLPQLGTIPKAAVNLDTKGFGRDLRTFRIFAGGAMRFTLGSGHE